ncbi:hypothetical protein JTE90_027691 [Oedothorax gibbosus]|uniref:LEM domain-containing protein n=1 Tax=Oedothorax gibbosus TaxID=931172 RepID=A0AAV6U0Z0_9ARAC|nr:hypothetical protein JTE90_027691 [Oedothorax gibbosus]
MNSILDAIFNCDLRKLKVLLIDKEKINNIIPGTEGCTPLHLIVGVEDTLEKDQVLTYFLKIGADPNARSYDYLTPVHIAAMWNNCWELEKLLQSGGNPWLTDNEKKNAFDLAINNHAYDAYQLLHKYLAEDKLNFRTNIKLPQTSTPCYGKENNHLNDAMIKDTKAHSRYFSTHEHLPLYFSSTDEESFINVSRILKKDLTKSQSDKSKLEDSGRIPSRKKLLTDICTKKNSSGCIAASNKDVCNTKFLSALYSNEYTSDCSEVPEEKNCNTAFFTVISSNKSTSDDGDVPKESTKNSEFCTVISSNKTMSDCTEALKEENCNYEFLTIFSPNKSNNNFDEAPKEKNCNSEFFSVIDSNKSNSDSEVPTEKNYNSEFFSTIYTDKYFSISNEASKNKKINSGILSDLFTDQYFSVSNEVSKAKTNYSKASTSEETEIYSASDNDCIAPRNTINDQTITILETDDKSGIVLIEKTAIPGDLSSVKSCNMSDCDNYANSDWKSCYSRSSSCLSEDSCSHPTSIFIPPDYRKLSNMAIYSQLKDLGDNPGPVSNSSRETYLRRLTKLKSSCNTTCILPKPKYCNEVYMFLDGKFDADRIQNTMNAMSKEFNAPNPKQRWREGNQRSSFNYFLLDPRVTQNLPSRMKQLTYEKAFLTFLDALFYVGKGMRSRPYSHLIEAAKAGRDTKWKSDKITHILDIWESGHGVISLHCFNNCIPAEAYTQEACIIDAVGLENLTNIKNGNYYGVASKWKWSWKRKIGVELLHRALQIFILEGEKEILPKDIRKN